MKKLTLRNYKRELQKVVKIAPPGEKHKFFSYAYFDPVPKNWKVHANTPTMIGEMKTAICYAGDIQRNFVDFYWLKKVNWEEDTVDVYSVEFRRRSVFYVDAVAIIPPECIPSKLKIKLMDDHEVVQMDKMKRKIRRKGLLRARGSRSSDNNRSSEQELQEQKTSSSDVSRQKVDGQKEEVRTASGIDPGTDQS